MRRLRHPLALGISIVAALAIGCRPDRDAAVDTPPVTEPEAPSPELVAAITCPEALRCLGIAEDLEALTGLDLHIPDFDAEGGGWMREAPGAVWWVTHDDDRLSLVAELPVDDARGFAALWAGPDGAVTAAGPGIYRVGDGEIVDTGDMLLLSPASRVASRVADGDRPLVPSDPGIIASGWIVAETTPAWVYERLDAFVAERWAQAQAAGDQAAIGHLTLLTDTVSEHGAIDLLLREVGEQWELEAHLFPYEDTWSARRAVANAAPECRLAALLEGADLPMRISVCEAMWSRPLAPDEPIAVEGPLGDLIRGFYAPGFVVEVAAASQIPYAGFAAARMPDVSLAEQLVTAVRLGAGVLFPSIRTRVYPELEGRDAIGLEYIDGDTPMPVVIAFVGDILLVTFGPDAAPESIRLTDRLTKAEPTAADRFALKFDVSAATQLRDSPEAFVHMFDTTLSLRTLDTHHVWSARVHRRLLHTIAASRRESRAAPHVSPDGA